MIRKDNFKFKQLITAIQTKQKEKPDKKNEKESIDILKLN